MFEVSATRERSIFASLKAIRRRCRFVLRNRYVIHDQVVKASQCADGSCDTAFHRTDADYWTVEPFAQTSLTTH